MPRVTLVENVLDALIRRKASEIAECKGVEPLPIVRSAPGASGANWKIPGWTGSAEAVRRCAQKLEGFVKLLMANFQLPPSA